MRNNTKYISIWNKTYNYLKQLSIDEKEPMTIIVQRLTENKQTLKKVEQIKEQWKENMSKKELEELLIKIIEH